MTPKQIDLVQASWEKILPFRDDAAALFYERLFELDPAMRRFFNDDMYEHGRRMMYQLGAAIGSLGRLQKVIPMLQELGIRQIQQSVQHGDYTTARNALLWTLEQGLAEEFTVDVRTAWNETYSLLTGVMQHAAADVLLGEFTD